MVYVVCFCFLAHLFIMSISFVMYVCYLFVYISFSEKQHDLEKQQNPGSQNWIGILNMSPSQLSGRSVRPADWTKRVSPLSSTWLWTNGVSTSGAAAKVASFAGLGENYIPWHFVGEGIHPKRPSVEKQHNSQ